MHNPTISAATKMSWAAYRITKRIEDRAYSLLGLFGVHLPLLYGEGDHAFQRLQQEIIRSSNDESIFASNWHGDFLPRSPAAFRDGHWIVPWTDTKSKDLNSHEPYSLTNMGLHIQLPLLRGSGRSVGVLACRYQDDFRGPIGLDLVAVSGRNNSYYVNYPRLLVVDLAVNDILETARFIYILQPDTHITTRMSRLSFVPEQPKRESKCLMRNATSLEISKLAPREFWNEDALTLWLPMRSAIEGTFVITSKPLHKRFAVLFSYTSEARNPYRAACAGMILIPLSTVDSENPRNLNDFLGYSTKDLQDAEWSAEFDAMAGSSTQTFRVSIERDVIFGESIVVIDISQEDGQHLEMMKAFDSEEEDTEQASDQDKDLQSGAIDTKGKKKLCPIGILKNASE